MSHSDFQLFTSPTNAVAQILLAHFVAILVLMAPIKSCEWAGRYIGVPNQKIAVYRLESIHHNVPVEMRKFLEWPMRATGLVF
jgi:hypothetical protein